MANNVQITIGADASNAESALKKFQDSVRKAGLALSAMGAGGALAIKGFTSAALEQERALKTLAAVVENTGESFSQVEAKILAATSALQKKATSETRNKFASWRNWCRCWAAPMRHWLHYRRRWNLLP
jgi:hypothetical protein